MNSYLEEDHLAGSTVTKDSMSDDPNHAVAQALSPMLVALADLADELQLHRGSIFKVSKRLGFQPTRRRDVDRGNQFTHLVTAAQASLIRVEVRGNRRTDSVGKSELPEFLADEGWFYLIQLEPEFDPGRVKVGFTKDLDGRISKHRCSAPLAIYQKYWPCRRTWEASVREDAPSQDREGPGEKHQLPSGGSDGRS